MSIDLRQDSRYLSTNLLTDSEGRLYFDLWKPILFSIQMNDLIYQFTDADQGRWDRLATKFYNNPNLWWVIPTANQIEDAFALVPIGTILRIPDPLYVSKSIFSISD